MAWKDPHPEVGASPRGGSSLATDRTGEDSALVFNLGRFPEGLRDPETTLCHRASDIRESEKLQIFKGLE